MGKKRKAGDRGVPKAKRNPLQHKLDEFSTLIQSESTVLEGLACFNKCARDVNDGPEFVETYLAYSNEAKSLMQLLNQDKFPPQQLQLLLEALEALFLHIAADPDHQNLGLRLSRRLVHNHLRIVYQGLSASAQNSLVVASLKLLATVVTLSPTIARETQLLFDFSLPSLKSFPSRRNHKEKGKDVRSCFVKFCLAFLVSGNGVVITSALGNKVLLSAIMKNLADDPLAIIHLVLSVLEQYVLDNTSVSKSTKIGYFSPQCLGYLVKLYERTEDQLEIVASDGSSQPVLLRDYVHKFLVKLCCSHEKGIAFRAQPPFTLKKSNNPVLLRCLTGLRQPWNDSLVVDLVTRLLTSCPDLVRPYFSKSSFPVEPKKSESWFNTLKFFINLVENVQGHVSSICPHPKYHPKELLPHVVGLLCPSAASRQVLSIGLQHKDIGVRFATCALLVSVMRKSLEVVDRCEQIAEDDFRWGDAGDRTFLTSFRNELEKLFPDVNLLLSVRHNAAIYFHDHGEEEEEEEEEENFLDANVNRLTYYAKVLEAVNCFVRLVPSAVIRSGYDFCKLLGHPRGDIEREAYLVSLPENLVLMLLSIMRYVPRGSCRWLDARTQTSSGLLGVLALLDKSERFSEATMALLQKVLIDLDLFQHSASLECSLFVEAITSCTKTYCCPSLLRWIESVIALSVKDLYSSIEEICHSSQATASFDIDAVLEKEDLDEPLSLGSDSFHMPFSPVVITCLQQYSMSMQATSDDPKFISSLSNLVSSFLLRLLHIQTNPECLVETVLKYVRPRKGESASSSEQRHLVAYFSAWSTAGEAFITVSSSSSEEMLEEGRAKLEKIVSSKQAKLTRRKVQRLTEKLYQVLLSVGPQLCIENAQKIIDFCDSCLERNYDVFIHYLKTHFGHFGDLPEDVQSLIFPLFPTWLQLAATSIGFSDEKQSFLPILPSESFQTVMLNEMTRLQRNDLEEVALTAFSRLYLLLERDSSAKTPWKTVSFFLALLRTSVTQMKLSDYLVEQIYPRLSVFSQVILESLPKPKRRGKTIEMPNDYQSKCLVDICAVTRSAFDRIPALRCTVESFASRLLDQIREKGHLKPDILFSLLPCLNDEGIALALASSKSIFLSDHDDCCENFVSLCTESSSERLREEIIRTLLAFLIESRIEVAGRALNKLFARFPKIYRATTEDVFFLLTILTPASVRICAMLIENDKTLAEALVAENRRVNWTVEKDVLVPVSAALLCQLSNTAGKSERRFCRKLADLYWEDAIAHLLNAEETEEEEKKIWCDLLVSFLREMKAKPRGKERCLRALTLLCARPNWTKYQLVSSEALARWMLRTDATDAVVLFTKACLEQLVAALKCGKSVNEANLAKVVSSWTSKITKNEDEIIDFSPLIPTWNDFSETSLRFALSSSDVLDIAGSLVPSLYSANADAYSDLIILPTKLFDVLVNQPDFFTQLLEATDTDEDEGRTRASLIRLVCALMNACPALRTLENARVLLVAYKPYLSSENNSLLVLLRRIETDIKLDSLSPYLWSRPALEQANLLGASSLNAKPGLQDVLDLLADDGPTMYKTAQYFPLELKMEPTSWFDTQQENGSLYDPRFLLPLFAQMMHPAFLIDCRQLIERGVLGLALCSLSSYDVHMRAAGYLALAEFQSQLDGARFREKPQLQMLLRNLVNAVTESNMRLPCLMTSFVAKAAHVLLKPDHCVYPLLNKFLLQRPVLELNDVPMFYELFNSSGFDFKAERTWMLHLLCEGLRDSTDYRIYQKRHVLEMAISYHDSHLSDTRSQELVLNLVWRALQIRRAALDLIEHRGLFSWLHGLILNSNGKTKMGKAVELMQNAFTWLVEDERERKTTLEECRLCCISAVSLGSSSDGSIWPVKELLEQCESKLNNSY